MLFRKILCTIVPYTIVSFTTHIALAQSARLFFSIPVSVHLLRNQSPNGVCTTKHPRHVMPRTFLTSATTSSS